MALTQETAEKLGISYLPDESYAKARGQLQLSLNGVFQPFMKYGLDVFVPGAIEEVLKLADGFGLRVRGVDQPIDIDMIRRETWERRK